MYNTKSVSTKRGSFYYSHFNVLQLGNPYALNVILFSFNFLVKSTVFVAYRLV